MTIPPFDVRLRILLITPDDMPVQPLLRRTEAALRGGVRAVQLRRKQSGGRAVFDLACSLRRMTRDYEALLFVNGRMDIARAVKADGVHCGKYELPLPVVRRLWPDGMIGCSAHSGDEDDEVMHADFATFSPVFASPGKDTPQGVEGLADAVARLNRPVLALGGVEAAHIPRLAASGAAGIAVIRSIYEAADPQVAASRLVGFMQETWHA